MGLDVSHDCWSVAYSAFMRWRCGVTKAAGLPPLQWMDGFYGWDDITHGEASAAVNAIGFSEPHGWARELLSAFYCGGNLPIAWDCLQPSPLHILLRHSDCDGEIAWSDCAGIADALEAVIPNLPDVDGGGHVGNWRETTKKFVAGLRLAAERQEDVRFH